MAHHRVKTHHWLSGTLRSREYFFDTLEDALTFLRDSNHHSAKVFDHEGRLVYESSHNQGKTYA
jgi:hypothetical protein